MYIKTDDPVRAFVPATPEDIRKAGYIKLIVHKIPDEELRKLATKEGVITVTIHGEYMRNGPGEYAIPAHPKSNARIPRHRKEENLSFGARDTLEDARKQYGIPFMMEAIRPIAKYFGVDKDELLRGWVRHYGPGLFHYMMQSPKTDNKVV